MFSVEDTYKLVESNLTSLPFDREPKGLYDPVRYMVGMGGKRLRPVLCLLSYLLFKKNLENSVLMPALGLELFHAFSLAHDDIMDDADVRRGKTTLHKKWNTNRAILSGDVMCIEAYTLISKCPSAVFPEVLSLFSHTAAQVCEGQQLDMDYELRDTITHQEYYKMISLKTAALIACAAKIGALCGGAPKTDARHLYDFGFALGLGFQIRDDYLDVFGDPSTFGKLIGGDILNNKKTWLLVDAQNSATEADQKRLHHLLHLHHTPKEKVEQMIELYNKLKIPEAAQGKINDFHQQSIKALKKVKIDETLKEQLYHYTTSLLNREK